MYIWSYQYGRSGVFTDLGQFTDVVVLNDLSVYSLITQCFDRLGTWQLHTNEPNHIQIMFYVLHPFKCNLKFYCWIKKKKKKLQLYLNIPWWSKLMIFRNKTFRYCPRKLWWGNHSILPSIMLVLDTILTDREVNAVKAMVYLCKFITFLSVLLGFKWIKKLM